MKRIRIGNTIHLSYALYKKSVEGKEPEDLTGIDVNVSLMNKLYNEILDAPVVVSGNVISMSIPGDIQKITGVYNLFVSYKKGEEDCAIDVDAFQLVDSSSKISCRNPCTCPEIIIDTVELEGEIDYSPTQVQSDWNQTDSSSVDYIKNKPEIPEWALNPEPPETFPDAPVDGKTYGRKENEWVEVSSAGNMDGGTALSVYGGALVMDGGSANN